jgi:hypothetical protein
MRDNPKAQKLKAETVKNILSLPDYDEKGYPNILKMEFVKRLKAKRKTLSLKLDD